MRVRSTAVHHPLPIKRDLAAEERPAEERTPAIEGSARGREVSTSSGRGRFPILPLPLDIFVSCDRMTRKQCPPAKHKHLPTPAPRRPPSGGRFLVALRADEALFFCPGGVHWSMGQSVHGATGQCGPVCWENQVSGIRMAGEPSPESRRLEAGGKPIDALAND